MHRDEPGTEERLTEAFLALRDRLMGTACLLLGHREDAREAVQEAFLKCWRNRRRLDGRAPPDGWIFTVLLNTARDARRRRRVRRTEALPGEEIMPLTEREAGPPKKAERRELIERIRALVAGLPEREREVFLLRQNGAMTYAAIAEATGAPVGTVKTRMRSALIRLREAFGPAGGR